jgi:hypothetical protein
MTRIGTAWRAAALAVLAVATVLLPAQADDAPPANNSSSTPPADTAPVQIGRSILVVKDVDGQLGDAPAHRLKINDDIVFSEDITTGADAKTVIEFRDGSTFEIGADAVVRIDAFIFNPEESTSHKAVQVTRGVFRYVSGYVASDQDTKITTPAGEMGIRGSVVEGIVDPSIPDFVYVGEGSATFTNRAGSSDLVAGASIAVPSATTPPMAPASMPAPVAAQAVQAIERRLPPRSSFEGRSDNETWLKQAGTANLVPVANQQQLQTAAAPRPLPARPARASLAGELGLLAEGNRVNLFHGGQGPHTPEQAAFIARAARDNPNAGAIMQRNQLQAQTLHRNTMTAGTALVIRGVGRVAPSVDVMRRVTAASVRANPGAEAAITRHATETYRGADRGQLLHPAASVPMHPQEHVVTPGGTGPVHPPEHNGGTVPVHPQEPNITPPHTPPGNQPAHVNPQNPVPRPPVQPNNLGPKLPQQRNVAPQPPLQNNLGPKLPQQRNVAPGPPSQQNNLGPKLPQQRNVTPQPPTQQRSFVPRPPPLQQRGVVPKLLPPKQPLKPPPKKNGEEQQR